MLDPRPSIELNMLASLQNFIGETLKQLYDSAGPKDYVIHDELSKAMVNSDKMTFILRALSKMTERGTPLKFDEQERVLLEELTKSHEFIRQRKVVVPFPQSEVDQAISYLGDFNDDNNGGTTA